MLSIGSWERKNSIVVSGRNVGGLGGRMGGVIEIAGRRRLVVHTGLCSACLVLIYILKDYDLAYRSVYTYDSMVWQVFRGISPQFNWEAERFVSRYLVLFVHIKT
jgi:hypothetical protein